MKRIKTFAICAIALAAMSFTAAAKRALRKAIDQARMSPGAIDRVYRLLGI